ncbi:MAG: TRAP transporter small permease [Gammaproteobacteria bacterium]|nr:TRAP transporter small permease [Gammaproteobacteria bacterium]
MDGWIAGALNALAILASVLVTGLMVFLVIARYVLGLSIVGLHELILLTALQLYMIGAIIASRQREHITVTWLAERITAPRRQAGHAALIAAITVVVTVFFIVWTYWMFSWGLQRPQRTPAYGIPLWILQVPILVAAVGCFLYALRDFVRAVGEFRVR